MRGGTDTYAKMQRYKTISIHPPHAGWDPLCIRGGGTFFNFNPPTPCGVGLRKEFVSCSSFPFQSTHPMRGGTASPTAPTEDERHFNPPTPCGVGPVSPPKGTEIPDFNPPTPCGVGLKSVYFPSRVNYFNPPTPCGVGLAIIGLEFLIVSFQSTHPMRGGTVNMYKMARYDWTQVTKETTIAAFIS